MSAAAKLFADELAAAGIDAVTCVPDSTTAALVDVIEGDGRFLCLDLLYPGRASGLGAPRRSRPSSPAGPTG